MRALPSVSVCIPVYRGEQFLAETIRSVLDQTYRDFELVDPGQREHRTTPAASPAPSATPGSGSRRNRHHAAAAGELARVGARCAAAR